MVGAVLYTYVRTCSCACVYVHVDPCILYLNVKVGKKMPHQIYCIHNFVIVGDELCKVRIEYEELVYVYVFVDVYYNEFGAWQDDAMSLMASPTALANETIDMARKLEERVAYLEQLVGTNLVSFPSHQTDTYPTRFRDDFDSIPIPGHGEWLEQL